MINSKTLITTALEGNKDLIALIGKDVEENPRIYHLKAPRADDYPRITFFEINNVDSNYADDDVTASEVDIQISIWVMDPSLLTQISNQVNKTMRAHNFKRYFVTELYEKDTGVYHKPMRYSANL
ncbi:tail completion protein gp17 [Fictibacillus sp. JL2B1089]|uniref:tail completion protein gp17 n=1 Tax=Fictibacillus sp. JL2B1089 TaxID=3399565 RepID=UPI003A898EB2